MKNHWLNKKLSIAVIERDGKAIRFTLSNSRVWKFSQIRKGVLEWFRMYPLLLECESERSYINELKLCIKKAREIFNGEVTSSKQV